MIIIHHATPHAFPFGARPSLSSLKRLKLDEWEHLPLIYEQSSTTSSFVTYGTSWFWQALVGLDSLSYPIMAHFALSTGYKWPGGRYFAPRVWIELSTLPYQSTDEGVECLWKAEGETYTIYDQLADGSVDPQINTADFWADFFTAELQTKRAAAAEALCAALYEANRMNLILESIPTA